MRQKSSHTVQIKYADWKRRQKIIAVLTVFVAFSTAYALMRPATTLVQKTYCGQEEHTHSKECYTTELVCSLEESEKHTHDASCYETVMTCDKEEHTHTAECFVDPDVDEQIGEVEEDVGEPSAQETDEESEGVQNIVLNDAGELTFEDDNYAVTVSYDADAQIPGGAVLRVNPLQENSAEYKEARKAVIAEKIAKDSSFDEENLSLAALDITILDAYGNEIEPSGAVKVVLRAKKLELNKNADSLEVQHLDESTGKVKVETVADMEGVADGIVNVKEDIIAEFTTENFSVYAIVGTTIEKNVLAGDGHNYRISVTCGADAGIPEGAKLEAKEILDTSGDYQEYVAKTENVLAEDEKVAFARFFDITITKNGEEIQPKKPVEVKIELADELTEDVKAVHFEHYESEYGIEENTETAVLLNTTLVEPDQLENAVGFETSSFSVYGIVETHTLPIVSDVSELDGNSFYLSIDFENARYYFKNNLSGDKIAKTNVGDIHSAGLYTFEKAADTDNQFYIYTYNTRNEKVYVNMADSGNVSFSSDAKSAFTVDRHNSDDPDAFYIYYTNRSGKECAWWYNNGGFNGKINARGARNKVVLTKAFQKDPYGLDGKSYGILNNQNTVSGTAMLTGSANNHTRLSGRTMTVRTEPVKRTENVFVANNSDITMWAFSSISGDQYYITADVNGELKYLRIDGSSVKLVSVNDVDDNCKITIEQGTGAYSGKYKFSSNGSALYLDGSTFKSAGDVTSGAGSANYWMNLAELSNLHEDDFVVYTAEKVSVSGTVNEDGSIDYDVKDGDQVIIYTRIWNEDTLRYDYYAIDYDGMLVKAYESGDAISWVGSKVNTMLWDFTEYHTLDEYGNDIPNYYYELQNAYSGKYIAPQVSETDFLSDSTIGINLNGRRNGKYYSTILAWDDSYYDYASLKVQDWQLTSAPISKADTFYFAVMTPADSEDQLTTVATIDHKPFGITLKMQDYEHINSGNRSDEQNAVLGNTGYNQWSGTKNLLTRTMADGYPTATFSGKSLSELYNNALEVNNQFLLNTYQETGYFEYDCTQNFAHLITNEDDKWYRKESPSGGTYQVGDFVVYNQLGTTTDGGATRQHGQFFPYNDLKEGYFVNWGNETDIHAKALSSLDPRKGEKLYAVRYQRGRTAPDYVDHFFGMEMSASFMQSASGLDAWGHDLIFEFSGDDDFWLYVDDMLVLDLGGIHSALDGSINFRTGVVIENGKTTNLRELYKAAYKEAHAGASDKEVETWLDGIFKENENGVKTVFKDYSGHTMRMFYMERGAGASNLHMRFNLAPYNNGEVLLEKEVSGVENVDSEMVFPFQIQYQEKDWPEDKFEYVTAENTSVTDAKTGDAILFKPTYEVNGITYQNIYLLKAGQTVSIALKDEDTKYFITECGLDTSIYDVVKANGDVLNGKDITDKSRDESRKDFPIEVTTVASRKKVIYNNHVSDSAQRSLTVTKKLWKDYEKTSPITDDHTEFRFRIYIGKDGDEYTVYNTGKYYVKDPDGNYCIYKNGAFQSTGKTVFSHLSTELSAGEWKSEQEQATFHTSPGGQADKIPAGYSIEIPGLMDGTAFFVEERDGEIPAGYNLIDYVREGRDFLPDGESANEGVISGKSEGVIVNNQHGYGLTVNKVWSDADFMENHDEIYFAVYRRDTDEKLTLLEDSVRQLGKTATSINWFFPELVNGKTLNDYVVYEVNLTEGKFSVDRATGVVSLQEGCVVTRIEENGTLTVGGSTNEHGYSANFVYTANYTREVLTEKQIEGKANSRTDTVTNSRPGIKLLKTDMTGKPLEGAGFTLVKSSDASTKKTFTSNEKGLIAVAYLTANEEYTLTETAAPYKYWSLIDTIKIKVSSDGKLYVNDSVTDSNDGYYAITQVESPTAENMPTVTIRNEPFSLQAVKVDAVNNEPISGIEFELYREVMDYSKNVPMPDYEPMDGFTNLTTDKNGLIPKINLDELKAGSYYLREKETTTQYVKLNYDIHLTISQTGRVSIQKAEYLKSKQQWVFSEIKDGGAEVTMDNDGNVTLNIRNTPAKGVQILKKGYETNGLLAEAEFSLYKMGQINNGMPKEGEEPLLTAKTGDDGIINLGALDKNTTYYLFETKSPDGYNMLTAPVRISTLSDGKVQAYLDNAPLTVETISGGADGVDVLQITVYNSAGYELPSTGGSGNRLIYVLGSMLTTLAGVGLVRRKRRI